MLEPRLLLTLRAVVANGSFSAAAAELGVTQPAVSRQIALLERRAKARLLHRSARGVRPTEAGRLLAGHAEALAERLALAEAQLDELAGLRRGHVRLGYFYTAFAQLAPEVMGLVEARHPHLTLDEALIDRATAFRQLAAGELDLAVVFEPVDAPAPPPPEVTVVPLFSDPVRVLLPAAHPLVGQAEVAAADLAHERWIRSHDGSAARLVDLVLARAGIDPPVRLAGHGEEPVETQVFVASGEAVTLAYDLTVLINHERIAVRPLADAPARRVEAAFLTGGPGPAAAAVLAVLRELGAGRAPQAPGGS